MWNPLQTFRQMKERAAERERALALFDGHNLTKPCLAMLERFASCGYAHHHREGERTDQMLFVIVTGPDLDTATKRAAKVTAFLKTFGFAPDRIKGVARVSDEPQEPRLLFQDIPKGVTGELEIESPSVH